MRNTNHNLLAAFNRQFALAFILSPETPWLLSEAEDLLGCWLAGGEL
jgi:hypothetical protein